MGKAEDRTATAASSQVPSERLPLLCPLEAPRPTYLSQEEVARQGSAAPWQRVRHALLGLLGGLLACMLAVAILLLVKMPQLRPALPWWQRATYYHLPAASFYDSDGDGWGDLQGVRLQVDLLLAASSIQALVLGPVLEGGRDNLTRVGSSYGSLEQLQALVAHGHEKGIRILLELPAGEEGPDPAAEDNMTAQAFQRVMQFWQEQGVDGFLVAKDPAWCLEAVLNAWSELDRQAPRDHREDRVLIIWDQSEAYNASHPVPHRVIYARQLLGAEKNLTGQELAQWVDGTVQHPRGSWPSWTVPRELSLIPAVGEMLGVLLFTLPGVPLLQVGEGSPIPLGKEMMESGTSGHPQANLYRSLLALRAKLPTLQGVDYAPLPLAGQDEEDLFAFLRPGSCSSTLVVLNLGQQPCLLDLSDRRFPGRAYELLFSTHPEPQREVTMGSIRLLPRQAILFRVPRGYRQ